MCCLTQLIDTRFREDYHITMAAASVRSNSFKIVLLGEGAVGKTSLVLRYVENKFNDKHLTTLQVRISAVIFGVNACI